MEVIGAPASGVLASPGGDVDLRPAPASTEGQRPSKQVHSSSKPWYPQDKPAAQRGAKPVPMPTSTPRPTIPPVVLAPFAANVIAPYASLHKSALTSRSLVATPRKTSPRSSRPIARDGTGANRSLPTGGSPPRVISLQQPATFRHVAPDATFRDLMPLLNLRVTNPRHFQRKQMGTSSK